MAKFTPEQFMQQVSSMASSFKYHAIDAVTDSVIAVEKEFDQNFDRQSFFGTQWASNKPSTIENKGHNKILHDSGKLRKSKKRLFNTAAGGFGGNISYKAISPRGSEVDYAPLQQYGFKTSKKSKGLGSRVPARPFVGKHHIVDTRIRVCLTTKIFGGLTRNYIIGR